MVGEKRGGNEGWLLCIGDLETCWRVRLECASVLVTWRRLVWWDDWRKQIFLGLRWWLLLLGIWPSDLWLGVGSRESTPLTWWLGRLWGWWNRGGISILVTWPNWKNGKVLVFLYCWLNDYITGAMRKERKKVTWWVRSIHSSVLVMLVRLESFANIHYWWMKSLDSRVLVTWKWCKTKERYDWGMGLVMAERVSGSTVLVS